MDDRKLANRTSSNLITDYALYVSRPAQLTVVNPSQDGLYSTSTTWLRSIKWLLEEISVKEKKSAKDNITKRNVLIEVKEA